MSFQLVLYTKQNCHLCEDAKAALELLQEGISFELIELDITEKDEWMEKYGLYIPVVEWQGEVIQYGQIVAEEVKKFINRKILLSNG